MTDRAFNPYRDVFFSDYSLRVMRAGNILSTHDTPSSLVGALMGRLAKVEESFGDVEAGEQVLESFYDYVRDGKCILGSPLLTNVSAGLTTLGSCTAVPLQTDRLRAEDFGAAESYYELNMGSGYDLSAFPRPVEVLEQLNAHAREVDSSGSCERYVGNMAHLRVAHPEVRAFIGTKTSRNDIVHFNLSVDVNEDFMACVAAGTEFVGDDGTTTDARELWDLITEAAWTCGDPGIISMDRYNATNPLAASHPYTTTAPWAEVGLSPGETCVFGYINVAACMVEGAAGRRIDLDEVGNIAECLVRVLDDALESSLGGYPFRVSSDVMAAKRKIGVSICGFADLLMWLGVEYGCAAALAMLADVLATINHRTKLASARLAALRGPFGAFGLSRYCSPEGFLSRFDSGDDVVSSHEWDELTRVVRRVGLRNVMTTALPPSGRSALLLGVAPSIEPVLALRRDGDPILPVRDALGGAQGADGDLGAVFATAQDIAPDKHLAVLEVAARRVDDGVSKTINLPSDAARSDVSDIYTKAWDAGLKAISVYRQGSRL